MLTTILRCRMEPRGSMLTSSSGSWTELDSRLEGPTETGPSAAKGVSPESPASENQRTRPKSTWEAVQERGLLNHPRDWPVCDEFRN